MKNPAAYFIERNDGLRTTAPHDSKQLSASRSATCRQKFIERGNQLTSPRATSSHAYRSIEEL